MSRIIVVAVLVFGLVGCGQEDLNRTHQLQAQVTTLEAKVSSLQAELEAERNGPDRLIARAQNELAADELGKSKSTLAELVARYPESKQARESLSLNAKIDLKIANAEKAKQAERERQAEKNRQIIAQLDKNLSKRLDEIQGVTWIRHKSVPSLKSHMELYFGTQGQPLRVLPLRMKLQYSSEDWLFVKSVTIKADEQLIRLGALNFERDNGSGKIWEWADLPASDVGTLNKIINAKKVLIRFDGRQYYNDFILPDDQKKAMRDIVVAWQRYEGNI